MRATCVALLLAALAAALTARAAETDIRYPAKVVTVKGEVYEFEDLRHELARGSFVIYDGEVEGRVSWRDLDKVTFVQNIRHGVGAYTPDAPGPIRKGTRRVRLTYVDGHERLVNMVVGRLFGHDGMADRDVSARRASLIDFHEAEIAPTLYKACQRGHVWEDEGYRFCPYDGLPLDAYRLDGGSAR